MLSSFRALRCQISSTLHHWFQLIWKQSNLRKMRKAKLQLDFLLSFPRSRSSSSMVSQKWWTRSLKSMLWSQTLSHFNRSNRDQVIWSINLSYQNRRSNNLSRSSLSLFNNPERFWVNIANISTSLKPARRSSSKISFLKMMKIHLLKSKKEHLTIHKNTSTSWRWLPMRSIAESWEFPQRKSSKNLDRRRRVFWTRF